VSANGNVLYCGENLEILRRHVADGSIDLVYLDPPFNSGASYRVRLANGEDGAEAFDDTWRWSEEAASSLHETLAAGGAAARALHALHALLGPGSMLAYLASLAPRLVELRRVLKDPGSLYLHCDPTASHHLKLLLDAVFGRSGFRNEIIWHYGGRGAKAVSGQLPRNHDVLLWYSKGCEYFYERQFAETLLTPQQARRAGHRRDERGRWFRTAPRGDYTDQSIVRLRGEGRIHETSSGGVRVKYFLETRTGRVVERRMLGDVWSDIPDAMHMPRAERLSYPTQKPQALLARVLATSCPAGGMVLDPYCGSGTTMAAAQERGCSWIGIDVNPLAISLTARRLQRSGCGGYRVLGIPAPAPRPRARVREARSVR
jgi:DNA modification methylase